MQRTVRPKATATIPDGAHILSAHLSSYVLWTHAQTPLSKLTESSQFYAYADAASGNTWRIGRLGYEGEMSDPRYYFLDSASGEKIRLTPETVKAKEVIVRTLTKDEKEAIAAQVAEQSDAAFETLSGGSRDSG